MRFVPFVLALVMISGFGGRAGAQASEPGNVVELPEESTRAAAIFTVRVVGEGRPMILIPGLSCDGSVWDATVDHFHGRHECHVFSLGGFAGNPRFDGPFLPRVREEITPYTQSKGLERPVVIGHSLGGVLAFMLAAESPELFGPIVAVDGVPYLPALINPAATPETMTPTANQMRRMLSSGGQEAFAQSTRSRMLTMFTDPVVAERYIESSVKSDPVAVGQVMYELYTLDPRATLTAIQSPVLLMAAVGGMNDEERKQSTLDNYRAQLANLPNARVVSDETSRHFLMIDKPTWFRRTVEEFLSDRD